MLPNSLLEIGYSLFVVPVAFNKEHKHMLAHFKQMLEHNGGTVAINLVHNKLITAPAHCRRKWGGHVGQGSN